MTWVRDGDAPTNHVRGARHQSQIKATQLGDTRRRFVGGNETSRRRRGSSVAGVLVCWGLSCEGGSHRLACSVARRKPAEGNTRAAWLVFWWLPLVTDRLAMDGSEPLSEYFRTVLMVGMAIIYLVQTKHS